MIIDYNQYKKNFTSVLMIIKVIIISFNLNHSVLELYLYSYKNIEMIFRSSRYIKSLTNVKIVGYIHQNMACHFISVLQLDN